MNWILQQDTASDYDDQHWQATSLHAALFCKAFGDSSYASIDLAGIRFGGSRFAGLLPAGRIQ
jgi:hypothetical protein